MKKANNYGSITKLSGKRRRPYIVTITDKKASLKPNADGSYSVKRKVLGYFEKKADAEFFLTEYNHKRLNVPSFNYSDLTFKKIWDIWAERELTDPNASRTKSYTAAFKKLTPLYNKRIRDIRLFDLQNIIDELGDMSKSSINNVKIVMGIVFEWAIKNDIIEKDYSQYVECKSKDVKSHQPLTHKEVDGLWAKNSNISRLILIYCYTGVRPSELLELSKSNIHINEKYFEIVHAKTAAGIRTVPIADKIIPYFKWFVNELLGKYEYNDYIYYFKKEFPLHTPHDTRSTFISFATEAGNDKILIQKIVGHKSGDVTTDIYTKLELKPLLKVVNSI